MKILVDNSVLRDAIVAQWDKRPHSVMWGNIQVEAEVAVMRRRPMPPPDQIERRKAILALPTIVRLAKERAIQLFTYEELNWEYLHGRNPAVASRGDLFAQTEMPLLETAVSRSFFRQAPFEEYSTKEALTEFCKSLLQLDDQVAATVSDRRTKLPEMTIGSLRQLSRFKELCRHAADGHLSDLFHIWSAERNQCSYFLTMEARICNFLKGRRGLKLHCPPIRPHELIQFLGIAELDPMPFDEGKQLDYFQAVDLDPET